MSANAYANTARIEKARHLADLLAGYGYRSFHCAAWEADQWRMATDAANALEKKKDPSAHKMSLPSDETRGLVIKMLRGREMLSVPQHA
jgi:hypothetical protein